MGGRQMETEETRQGSLQIVTRASNTSSSEHGLWRQSGCIWTSLACVVRVGLTRVSFVSERWERAAMRCWYREFGKCIGPGVQGG